MDKDNSGNLKEMEDFIALSPEDREKETEALKKKIKSLGNKITVNSKNLEQTERRLSESRARLEVVKIEYADLRERRQRAILLDQDSKEIVPLLRSLAEEEDLLNDTIIALSRGIDELKSEGDRLPQEKTACEKSLLRLRLIPLVSQFNSEAELLGTIIIQINEVMEEMDEVLSPWMTSSGTVFVSNFEGLEKIPKLYLAGDVRPEYKSVHGYFKDTFNFQHHLERLRKEKEAKRNIESDSTR